MNQSETIKKMDRVLVIVLVIISLLLIILIPVNFSINGLDGTWGHTYFPASILLYSILSFIVFYHQVINNRKTTS